MISRNIRGESVINYWNKEIQQRLNEFRAVYISWLDGRMSREKAIEFFNISICQLDNMHLYIKNSLMPEIYKYVERIKAEPVKPAPGDNLNKNTIIKELRDALVLKNDLSENGKCIHNQSSDRVFVKWIVDNNYDDFVTEKNYFDIFECKLKMNTIQRYFEDARAESK